MSNHLSHPMSHSLIRALLMLPILLCIASGLLKLPYATGKSSAFGRVFFRILSAVLKCGEFCNRLVLLMIVSVWGPMAFLNRKRPGSTWVPDPLASASINPGPPLPATGFF